MAGEINGSSEDAARGEATTSTSHRDDRHTSPMTRPTTPQTTNTELSYQAFPLPTKPYFYARTRSYSVPRTTLSCPLVSTS